jgi:ABC-type transporter Mla MlaB component
MSVTTRLAELLARWCDTPLSLRFEGAASLLSVLRAMTPAGDKTVPKTLWQLLFDVLRLLRLQDDYELAALDFCVTFEVSPPSWRLPLCQLAQAPQALAVAVPEQALASRSGVDLPSVVTASPAPESAQQLALSGEVMGDVSDIVDGWQRAGGQGGVFVVSCAHLIRVDFSAAGGLLNWVAHMTAENQCVEFRDLPRLVAAFFNLIGINEHAQVTARTN